MSFLLRVQAAALLVAFASFAFCQDGVSTAGLARTKYFETTNTIPPAKEIVVEDFINYHRHELPRPKAGDPVALDVRWMGSRTSNGESILQVGISTALTHDVSHLRPINLCLVIDKSGSMNDDHKLDRVKVAVETLLDKLRPSDKLSIVAFDDEASVVLPSQRFGYGSSARVVIENLCPGTSTNLNGGLMLGYEEAEKNFDENATNRVILLTDGIANVGTISADDIAANSLKYNERGIDLSTIAVGRDVNMDLLATLAKSGHGLFHFVEDSQDIKKVFQDEAQSLLSPVARDATVEIDGPVDQVFGYEPQTRDGKTIIHLADMNSGMTEVVLARVRQNVDADPVKVRLSFRDAVLDKPMSLAQSAPQTTKTDDAIDETVQKNYAIALLAQSIHDMADGYKYNVEDGYSILDKAIKTVQEMYPHCEDPDINRVLNIAISYRDKLDKPLWNYMTWRHTDDILGIARNAFNGNFSQGNFGFTSDLQYVYPVDNCLWPVGYTIASTFSHPQLHHLISSQDFAAPDGGNVMFANAGGTGELMLWSSTAACKPHTRYLISFHSISLTPRREWIPTYEIRVNDFRSAPQISTDGRYNTISTEWTSDSQRFVQLRIVRLPIPHGGGIVGICNITMTPEP